MGQSNYVHIEVDEIKAVTDSAFLLRIGNDQIWIPRSQIANDDDYEKGDEDVTISMSEWIAKKHGLETD